MEIIANAPQLVATNQNVIFTDTVIGGCNSIIHRAGSGLVTLRGLTRQCRARFKVYFNSNVALPSGATVSPTSLAIAINGEPVTSTIMITTPAAVLNYWNISAATYVDVPAGCCTSISVINNGTESTLVENANFIIERVA